MAIEMNIENFSSMIDNIIAGICFFEYENDNFIPIFVNEGFFRMLGYSRANGMQYLKDVRLNIIPEDLPVFEQAIADVLKDDGAVETEFRTVTGNGSLRWLQVRGNLYAREGEKYVIVTVIQDITEKKSVEEELRLQAERLHIILEAEDEKILDYNAKTDVLVIKTSGSHTSSEEIILNRYLQHFNELSIYEEDMERFQEIFDGLLRSPKHDTVEVRTRRFDDTYTWYQMNLTSLLGAEGYVTRIVGRLINIHETKMKQLMQIFQVDKDSLTGLSSKKAAQQLIRNALHEKQDEEQLNALILINLDDFKEVNERIGHAQGDKVLTETGERLREIFKGSDIVGRLGADLFVVYMNDLNTLSDIDVLAPSIVKRLDFHLPYVEKEIHVTCSVGIAICPYHGTSYAELYEKAGRALSKAKANGKCGYRIYDAAVTMAYHAIRKRENATYDPEKGMELPHSTEDMVMQVLFEDRIMEAALRSAIELITVRYKFHRGYICGSENGSLPISKQVQFTVHGHELGRESQEHLELRRVVYEILYESYKNCSIIHAYDMMEEEMRYFFQSEGIKSLLYYPITSKGEFKGAIVFENHEDVQLEFEDSELEELRSMLRILEAHILQIGLMNRLQDFATQIELLDNLDSFVYIVNTDTYELSFINKKVLMQLPEVKIGDICYRALQHRDSPCEHCIFSQMNKNDPHERRTEEIFIYALRCWARCSASWMEHNDENTLGLLNCIDISEYFIG